MSTGEGDKHQLQPWDQVQQHSLDFFPFILSFPTSTLGKLFPSEQTSYKQQINLTVVLHSQTFFRVSLPLPQLVEIWTAGRSKLCPSLGVVLRHHDYSSCFQWAVCVTSDWLLWGYKQWALFYHVGVVWRTILAPELPFSGQMPHLQSHCRLASPLASPAFYASLWR